MAIVLEWRCGPVADVAQSAVIAEYIHRSVERRNRGLLPVGGKAIPGCDGCQLGVTQPVQPAGGANPQASFAIFEKRQNIVVGQALLETEGRVARKRISIFRNALDPRSFRARPKIPLRIFE